MRIMKKDEFPIKLTELSDISEDITQLNMYLERILNSSNIDKSFLVKFCVPLAKDIDKNTKIIWERVKQTENNPHQFVT